MCARALVIHTQLTSTAWTVKFVLNLVLSTLFLHILWSDGPNIIHKLETNLTVQAVCTSSLYLTLLLTTSHFHA